MISIRQDDPARPEITALLEAHLDYAVEHTLPENIFALDVDALKTKDITFWAAWNGESVIGCGALKELNPRHGEIKSMHTAASFRGTGVASQILQYVIKEAKCRSYERLSLETGSNDGFAPARALYRHHGFVECAAFAGYPDAPTSTFMTLELARTA